MGTFRAIRVDKAEKGTTVGLTQFDEADLMEGDVTIRVEWSTLNYKDGLAVTGKAPVVRRFPMIAGIDFAGIVEQSSHPQWKAGYKVVCNGWGMGETHLGSYAEKARIKGDWQVRLPVVFVQTATGSRSQSSVPAMHSLMSLHLPPVAGAVYPAAQAHAYVPGKFAQLVAFGPHGAPVAHSFVSVHVPAVGGAA